MIKTLYIGDKTFSRRLLDSGVWRRVCQWPTCCLHDYGRLVIANRLGRLGSLRRAESSTECGVSSKCDREAPLGEARTRNRSEAPQEKNKK